MTDALVNTLKDLQDRDADIALLRSALRHESVTGNEANFVSFLLSQMVDLDLAPRSADFLPGRPNIWGVRKGPQTEPGRNLMFTGHTDTVHVRGWADHWEDDPRNDPFGGAIVDGHVWGRGACDLKGGICAALAALRLLDRAGITLANNLSFAFIGDEESGEVGTGVSAGAKDLTHRILSGTVPKPDFAVYVEPTKLDVYTAQIGFFIADVKITGKSAYFGTPDEGVDALKATHKILSAVWAHSEDLRSQPHHDLVGPSDVLVTHLSGGGYIAVPGECSFSVIRKLRPGEDLSEAVVAFESVVRGADIDPSIEISFDYPAGRDHPKGGSPVEIDRNHPAAAMLQSSLKDTGATGGDIGGAPYWSESPFWVDQLGCPTVYCAPGNIAVAHTFEERISIDAYLDAVRAYALFMTRFCGVVET